MKSKSLIMPLVTLTMMLTICPIRAQAGKISPAPDYRFITLAGGASSHGLSAYVSAAGSMKTGIFKIRYSRHEELNILGPDPSENVWDIGLMRGVSKKSRTACLSFSSGLALVGGVRRGEYLYSDGWFSSHYERDRFLTVGIPVETHFVYALSERFGLGFLLFANLNFEESFIGMAVSLELGRLK
ncbi:hypothetical protein JW835_05155 [bacterium]|nr:hypothetical protein [bacterium]